MAISNLYISYKSYDWSKFLKVKKDLLFLNKKNLVQSIDSIQDLDVYTSIEDLTLDQIENLLFKAKSIHLIDINSNSLSNIDNLYTYSYWLSFLMSDSDLRNKVVGIKNIDDILDKIKSLHKQRSTESKTLWVAGCSITAGVGVNNDQRFGYHISKELDLPEMLIAKAGASIFWAADQLLRSDIKKDDIVIWGITSTSRIDIANEFTLTSVPISGYLNLPVDKQYWKINYFYSPTQIITNLRYIQQVVNFCSKIGAKLYLVNLVDPTWAHLAFSDEIMYINLTKKFNFKTNKFLYSDLGTDNDHPGPRQHKEYAEQILNFIKENNHGN